MKLNCKMIVALLMVCGVVYGDGDARVIELEMMDEMTMPRIDGVIEDDEGWKDCEWQDGFWVYQENVTVDQKKKVGKEGMWEKTKYKVGFDESYVFVGVKCDEAFVEKMKAAKTARDGEINVDDCVEVMLGKPGRAGEYYHFIVNSLGTVFDDYRVQGGHMGNKSWDCAGLKMASRVGEDWWSVEMAIPFASLGISDAGVVIKGEDLDLVFNVGRERYASGQWEVSSSSKLDRFLDASRYSTIRLKDFDAERFNLKWARDIEISRRWSPSYVLGESDEACVWSGMIELMRDYKKPQREVWCRKVGDEEWQPGSHADKSGNAWWVNASADKDDRLMEIEVREYETGFVLWRKLVEVEGGGGKPFEFVWVKDRFYADEKGDTLSWVLKNQVDGKYDMDSEKWSVEVEVEVDGGEPWILSKQKNAWKTYSQKKLRAEMMGWSKILLHGKLLYDGKVIETDERVVQRLISDDGVVRLKDGLVYVDGQRFYPFGWFSVEEKDWGKAKEMGCNTLMIYSLAMDEPEEQNRKLDKLAAMGMKVVIYPYPERWMLSEARHQALLNEEERAGIRELVERVKDHEAILGWYIGDEPELKAGLVERFKQVNALIREVDPKHPTILVNNSTAGIADYAECADILMPDPYPFFLKKGSNRFGIDVMKRLLEVAILEQGKMLGERSVWVTPQGFSMADFGNSDNREPNEVELRNMFYQSISLGAAGQIWWAWRYGKKYPEMMGAMAKIGEEYKQIKWVLEDEDVKFEKVYGEGYVGCRFMKRGRAVLDVLVNLKDEVNVVHGRQMRAMGVWAVLEGRQLKSN
ncbi:hypothetical protein JD969_11425 [Planctomycetota bacterium]|nr:hypothetical protein JD969_11425 [Planctomycetota bacterium]